jgi:hypothetical protein
VATLSLAGQAAEADALVRDFGNQTMLFADRQGLDADTQKILRAEAISGARLAQVTALANADQPERAREVLEKQGGVMSAQDRERAEKAVEASDLTTRAQRATDELVAAHLDNEADALRVARERYEGRLEDEVVSRIRARFSERAGIQNQADQTTLQDALQSVQRTGLSGLDASQITTLERRGWMENVRTMAAHKRNGTAPVTDYRTWYDVLIPKMEDGTIRDVDPWDYVGKLNDRDFATLQEAVTDARGGSTGGKKGNLPALSAADRDLYIFDVARDLRLLPDNDVTTPSGFQGEKNINAYQALRDRARLAVEEMEREKGRNLSSSEIRNAIRLGFATLKAEEATAAAVTRSQRAGVPLPAVPLTPEERTGEDWDGYVARLQRNFSFTRDQAVEAADRAFGVRP